MSCSLAQHYEGEYDDDDHSSYESESDEPDYSKYYAGDGGGSAAALIDVKNNNGFVNPAEFSSFFSAPFYAASNNQEITKDTNNGQNGFVNSQDFQAGFADFKALPFGGKDFFEQAAQKQIEKTNKPETNDYYELKPGPSYVSHKIVPPAPKKSKYASELEDLNKPYNHKNIENQDDKVIPLYSGAKQKIVDPKYVPQYTPKNQNNLTPYQKYSFQTQPATLSTFASASTGKLTTTPTYANYDYLYTPSTNNEYKLAYDAAATNLNSKLQDFNNFKPSQLIKECKKINKHVPGTKKNSKPMDCYVCKDAKGISYEECFYGQASESNPKNYYIETSKEYSEPTQVQSYNFNRYKRYTVSDNSKDDPYEYLKKQSEKYYHSPDFESSYKHPKSFEEDYRYGGGDGEEKSSSEQIADQLVKSGDNCRKVNKDGMTCTICENKKTGGNYEQCSYSSAPEEKKYAYSKQRKYNREDEPTEETDSSEEQPVSNKKPQQFYKPKSESPRKQKSPQKYRGVRPNADSYENTDEVERIKPVNTNRQVSEYTVPKHFANINVSPESAESEEDQPENEEYYYIIPSQTSESKRDEQKQDADHESAEEEDAEPETHYGYYGEESKKDVEEVLAEFAKKDRSKCKKAEKNGMTCYLCIDKKGLQHEECMYVSESRPQSKYQAYHAQKETDGREGAEPKTRRNEENAEESKVKSVRTSRSEPRLVDIKYPAFGESTTESLEPQRRRRPKKAVDANQKQKDKTKSRISRRNYSERLDDTPVDESKDEYRVEGEKGAFSHETEPVFSKKYGVTLPKFMLTRSEGEKVYDEFVQSKS